MSVLFINACVRRESRTKILALNYLKSIDNEVIEVDLQKIGLQPLDEKRLEKRDYLIKNNLFDDEFFNLARQFKEAEEIVVASPFWDLSFPSLLKIYFENVTVSGITFKYNMGKPQGLCKAKKLTYITTAGGKIVEDFGYSYVKSIVKGFYGVKETTCIKVENLDVNGVLGEDVLKEKAIITN